MLDPSKQQYIFSQTSDYILSTFSGFLKIFDYKDALFLIRKIVPRMFMQGEEIFKQQDSSNGIYLILKG